MNRTSAAVSLPLTIPRAEVLHFLGYPAGENPPQRIETRLEMMLAEARGLVDARGVFAKLPVERAEYLGLQRIDAAGVAIGIVTIGDGVERRAADLMKEGAATDALLLDAAGSAAAEEAADRLGRIIAGEEGDTSSGDLAHISCRVSPGYGLWPIRSQALLFEVLPHEEIGVSLLATMLMVPRKSISFAMWLGADARPIAGLSGCARCELERCRYRRERA